MIYLLTGTLGTGKTAAVVSWMQNNHNKIFTHDVVIDSETVELKRPIYVYEIRGLDNDHFGSISLKYDDLEHDKPLHEQVPCGDMADPSSFGAVVIIDEAQIPFPVRSPSQKVTALLDSFAMVRQYNINVILITQHPSSIDKFIRDRLAIHYHLERHQVGTRLYEFYRCETDLSRYAMSKAVSVPYSPDKKIFKYYKSAASHAKVKKRLHWSIKLAIPIILLMFLFFGYIIMKATGFLDTKPVPTTSTNEPVQQIAASDVSTQSNQSSPKANDNSLKPSDFVPSILEKPESKPIYDSVRQVKTFEQIRAVVISKGKCTAYSQQGTVVDVPDNFCRKWANEGLPFDPYKDIQQIQNQQSTQITPKS